jgi:hypothetical protein
MSNDVRKLRAWFNLVKSLFDNVDGRGRPE